MTDERKLQICAMALFDVGHDTQEIYDFLSAIDPDIDVGEALAAAADAIAAGDLPPSPTSVRLRSRD